MENNELKTVVLKYYESPIKAEVDKDVLTTNGIECFLGDDFVDMFPLVPTMENNPRIIVFERDFDRAQKILDDFQHERKKINI
ncbi:MAG: DUF2007 domain-containing protein [Paludibacter sp.]|nr:DUF2007 domain-containing protein [Paludibacter sp.]